MGTQEGKDATEGGVSLLLVVLVISIFVALAIFGLNLFTKGQNRVSQTAGTLDSAQFSAYDNKLVTGDEVMAAVRTYITQNIVIVVDNNNTDIEDLTGSKGSGDTKVDVLTQYPSDVSKAQAYNVGLLAQLQTEEGASKGGSLNWCQADGRLYAGKIPDNASNMAMTSLKNTNIRPLTTRVIDGKTSGFYVESGAQYYAILINDPSTKTVNGIVFVRQAV